MSDETNFSVQDPCKLKWTSNIFYYTHMCWKRCFNISNFKNVQYWKFTGCAPYMPSKTNVTCAFNQKNSIWSTCANYFSHKSNHMGSVLWASVISNSEHISKKLFLCGAWFYTCMNTHTHVHLLYFCITFSSWIYGNMNHSRVPSLLQKEVH
jgi:hypothetical protein